MERVQGLLWGDGYYVGYVDGLVFNVVDGPFVARDDALTVADGASVPVDGPDLEVRWLRDDLGPVAKAD